MEYTQIKVTSTDDATRFNRTIAILGDPNLYRLGAIIGLSVNAWFEHCYLFKTSKPRVEYIFDDWESFGFCETKKLSEAHLSDLGEKFSFEYDTGEGYDFYCKVLKRKYIVKEEEVEDEYPKAIVVKGSGQGIFENDHLTLYKYLSGKINPESEGNEDAYEFLPMNMCFDKFGDFDKPLDLDEYVFFKEDIDEITNNFER